MYIRINRTIERSYESTDVTSQDLVRAATDAKIRDAMPRHGETHEDWVDRLLSNEPVLSALISNLAVFLQDEGEITDELDTWEEEE